MNRVVLSREIGLLLDKESRAPWRRKHPGFSDDGLERFHEMLEELTGTEDYRAALDAIQAGLDFQSDMVPIVRCILEAYFRAEELNAIVTPPEERDKADWVPDGHHYVEAKLV